MGPRKRIKQTNEVSMNSALQKQNIRVRHVVDTKTLAEVNGNLTGLQKERLLRTPFKWVVSINQEVRLSGVLLRELVSKWMRDSGGFRVRRNVVPFTPLHVCFALGLRIVGKPMSIKDEEEEVDCHVKQLFEGKDITVQSILEKLESLNNDESVEDFCRVYILLAFSVLYFPRTSPTVNCVAMKLLDDLNGLDQYNWGGAVYNFLEESLSRASRNFIEGNNRAQVHIVGCAAILQIWAIMHFSLMTVSKRTTFSRILGWTELAGGKSKIVEVISDNQVVEVMVATEDDKQHDILIEALNEAEKGHLHWSNRIFNLQDLLVEQGNLKAKSIELEKRISALEDDVKFLKDELAGKRTLGSHEGHEHQTEMEETDYVREQIGEEQQLQPVHFKSGVQSNRSADLDHSSVKKEIGGSYCPPPGFISNIKREQEEDFDEENRGKLVQGGEKGERSNR